MKLDIIVPHYKEEWSVGKPLFDILGLQRAVDFSQFRVLLVNDGEDCQLCLNTAEYPYDIREITKEHKGVSAARNRGLEESDAEWVMFCDFDDTFSSIYSLRAIMDLLDDKDHDLIWFPFYVEVNRDHDRQIREEANNIFIHSKIYRRSFLMEHEIRFPEHLRYAEDGAFCKTAEMEVEPGRIGKGLCEFAPYVWTYRVGSVTTKPEFVLENAMALFRGQGYIAEQCRKHGIERGWRKYTIRAMCDAYTIMTRNDNKDQERKDRDFQEILSWYGSYPERRRVLHTATPEEIASELASAIAEASNGRDKGILPGGFWPWILAIEKGETVCSA